jgi:hypothetical protein
MGGKDVREEREPERDERGQTYDLTYKDVVDILEVIENSMCRELHIESGDLKLTVEKRW